MTAQPHHADELPRLHPPHPSRLPHSRVHYPTYHSLLFPHPAPRLLFNGSPTAQQAILNNQAFYTPGPDPDADIDEKSVGKIRGTTDAMSHAVSLMKELRLTAEHKVGRTAARFQVRVRVRVRSGARARARVRDKVPLPSRPHPHTRARSLPSPSHPHPHTLTPAPAVYHGRKDG